MVQLCFLAEPWPFQQRYLAEPSKLPNLKPWIWRRIVLPNPGMRGPFVFAHKPNQRKVGSWTFRGGKFEPKFDMYCACFLKEKTPEFTRKGEIHLECRKWGFKRWGFKQIWGYLRKKAFFLRFLDFPGAVRALRKRAKKAEKGRKRPISADFQHGRTDTP